MFVDGWTGAPVGGWVSDALRILCGSYCCWIHSSGAQLRSLVARKREWKTFSYSHGEHEMFISMVCPSLDQNLHWNAVCNMCECMWQVMILPSMEYLSEMEPDCIWIIKINCTNENILYTQRYIFHTEKSFVLDVILYCVCDCIFGMHFSSDG